eukprot:6201756-Pleurochrysis_carterae.AAC.1
MSLLAHLAYSLRFDTLRLGYLFASNSLRSFAYPYFAHLSLSFWRRECTATKAAARAVVTFISNLYSCAVNSASRLSHSAITRCFSSLRALFLSAANSRATRSCTRPLSACVCASAAVSAVAAALRCTFCAADSMGRAVFGGGGGGASSAALLFEKLPRLRLRFTSFSYLPLLIPILIHTKTLS